MYEGVTRKSRTQGQTTETKRSSSVRTKRPVEVHTISQNYCDLVKC